MKYTKYNNKACHLFLFLLSTLCITYPTNATLDAPKLTVMLVIDQMAYNYIPIIQKHVRKGLKKLLEQGISYDQAYMDNAMPATATGHATLSTGVRAKDHGIIGNKWITPDGTKILCDDDIAHPTHNSTQPGKSPHHLMVHGITDSFVRSGTECEPHHAYAISGKSRAAIFTANHLGKAFWWDDTTGHFTSSSYYYDRLPKWVDHFNKQTGVAQMQEYTWEPAYSLESRRYCAAWGMDYSFTAPQKSFIGRPYLLNGKKPSKKTMYDEDGGKFAYLHMTPFVNQLIFDFATNCIQQHLNKCNKDRMLLWVCISSLDKVGHIMGPQSYEVLDTLYHLDKQLDEFMTCIHKTVGLDNTLFVLTADHGASPIPNLAHHRGLHKAQRINEHDFLNGLTKLYGSSDTKDLISLRGPNLYLFGDSKVKEDKEFKNYLLKQPFIKKAWTFDELLHTHYKPSTIEGFFKDQLFPGRSGNIIIQMYPNCLISDSNFGASHDTPYNDDTHIPIIFYQRNRFEQSHIAKRVYATQIAPTLSTILKVPMPDASTAKVLPQLLDDTNW